MLKTIIKFNYDIPENRLNVLKIAVEAAFRNGEGTIENSSDDPRMMIFEGAEDQRACLDLGILRFRRDAGFLDEVDSWIWIDDQIPVDNGSILEIFLRRLEESDIQKPKRRRKAKKTF